MTKNKEQKHDKDTKTNLTIKIGKQKDMGRAETREKCTKGIQKANR
jgi:hypothetical protein